MEEQKIALRYPIFRPVSLPDFQIGNDSTIVLGHFPEYLFLAAEIGAEVFNVPEDEWQKLDEEGRWTANRKFLDDAIERDDEIVLSTTEVRRGSWFERELRYLASKGYRPDRSGGRIVLIRIKQPRI